MAHGLNSVLRRGPTAVGCNKGEKGIGSRRIFAPHFKLQVLDSYRNDADCKGNQRATARKYGIHRRQIQKWLQCENNLRNSVGKAREKCGAELSLRSGQHRQRDDAGSDACSQTATVPEARAYSQSPPGPDAFSQTLPEPEPRVPLDFTIHSRSLSPGAPMDLSLKRSAAPGEVSCPPPLRVSSPNCLVPLIQPHPDIWDLSLRSQKRNYEDTVAHSPNPEPNLVSPVTESQPKPVKLFKPYLDDLNEDCQDDKPRSADQIIPPCCNRFIPPLPESEPHFYNNNNHIAPDYSYTLHELQPKSTINYYYTINKNYIYTPECEGMPFCTAYDTTGMLHHSSPPLKQRQSYSLDFKLSAIECYYQDSMCRGNQRAVANKYNIHRRQVQKWLKQEDELRNRNENTKHINVVR